MPHFAGYPDFSAASNAVLDYLHETIGFDLWMVTRTEGEDWIVLESCDHGYGVASGDVFHWADSFCSRMVQGKGPCIAPVSDAVPAYAEAPIGKQVRIGAYIGFPLNDADGGLFGTLCGIDPRPQDERLVDQLPLIELLGRLLNSYLVAELKLKSAERKISLQDLDGLIDQGFGGFTERGWNSLVAAEENRCKRYGHSAAVIAIAPATEDDISTIMAIAKEHCTSNDCFHLDSHGRVLMLLPECGSDEANEKVVKLQAALERANVQVNTAVALRDPRADLAATIEFARTRVEAAAKTSSSD